MPFKPVILWTDSLIYLLLIVVMVFAWYVRRNEHLLIPWKRVGHSVSGMMALTVLILFITIGLLDTIHFRPALENNNSASIEKKYDVKVLSLFDIIATPLRTNVEKTYSAPFATHLYSKEIIELPEGGQIQEFPRLKFGGSHLQNPEKQFSADIAWRTAEGLCLGFLIWLISVTLLVKLIAYKSGMRFMPVLFIISRGETEIPWKYIFIMSALLLLIFGITLSLSTHYHIFGTDKVGQDVFYQALKSIRIGLIIGTITTLMMLPFALILGITAGYFKGWVDDVIQYLYTTLSSIPSVLLIAASVLMMQVYIGIHPELFDTMASRADLRLLFLCIIPVSYTHLTLPTNREV